MKNINNKFIDELVGGDVFAGGSDRNAVSNSEIETGPVEKPYNDDSDYEKGASTTSDKVFGRYRQNIPWFAVYSYGGGRVSRGLGAQMGLNEKSIILKKKNVEEKIEDLVKKSKSSDVTEKGYNPKVDKLIDTIKDSDLSVSQLEELKKAIEDKTNNINPKKI